MIAALHHPNVVEVYDVGEIEGQLFVAMELVDGVPLDRWLVGERRQVVARAARDVFVQAGHGLAAAHEAGLVHRDFKPANVLVGADGRVARHRLRPRPRHRGPARSTRRWRRRAADDPSASRSTHRLTTTGVVLGTPAYMAPEQYEADASMRRSDQYSFCVALYEALYRRRPFDANDPQSLRTLVLSGAVPPIPTTIGGAGLARCDRVARDPARSGAALRRHGHAARCDRSRARAATQASHRRARRHGRSGGDRARGRHRGGGRARAVRQRRGAPARDLGRLAARGSGRVRARDRVAVRGSSWANASRKLDARALAWAQLHEQVCADARERGAARPPSIRGSRASIVGWSS